MNSRRGPELHFYRCNRVCRAVTSKSVYTGRYERCRACRNWALYQYSVPVETERHRELFARGVVLNPYADDIDKPHDPSIYDFDCVRCGVRQVNRVGMYCADGRCCDACYAAQSPEEATV